MKDKLIPSIIIISFIIIFLIFYKGLQETNIYTPKSEIKKDIPIFLVLILTLKKMLIHQKYLIQINFIY